ncbi:hypothetical protein EDD22DRAFT_251856 [Suillus occidentalis]|nr:hypothetical protein EDD22DRAFT_251856 [Suillus occidentalis]
MVGVQVDKKDIVRIDKSSALPRFANALLAQFQTVLWECDGGDLDKDNIGVTRRAWNLLDVICRILEPAKLYYNSSFYTMRNLDVCKKIYLRARSSEQNHSWESWVPLQNVLRFTLTAAKISRDPVTLWYGRYVWTSDSHSPEDFDWLVDYLDCIDSYEEEAIFDILLTLDVMKVRCSPAKQHLFIKNLIVCMDSGMPHSIRHIALRLAHSAREEIASIDTMDVELRDMVLTEFSPAILTAVCPQPGATLANDDLGHSLRYERDLCYLELIFALSRNSNWHPHLFEDHHVDWCISMIEKYKSYTSHTFYLTRIFLQIAPEQLSVTSLDSITEQQWWSMTWMAWSYAFYMYNDTHYVEFLPVLVEATKRYMQIAVEHELEELIRFVDCVLGRRDSEQGEDVAVAVKELRTVASDMLEKLVNSKGVNSP